MNEHEVKKKIKYALKINSESGDLEFKAARDNVPREIWKSISAFSHNRGGGIIVFGVREDPYEIAGCKGVDQMQIKLIEFFNDKMSYPLRPKYYVIPFDDKNIIAIYVPECPKEHKPCYYLPVGLPKGAYIREGNTNRPLTDNEFRTYIASSKQFQFDLSEAPNAKLSDLSKEKIKFLLDKKEDQIKRGAQSLINNELLRNLGIARDYNFQVKPTIAGYLIFAENIIREKYPYDRYTIRCVRFAGSDSASDIIDKLDISGTLDEQIDETYKFILRNISKTAYIAGTKRSERYEYPEQAIRELIANSVIHRDYKIIETYIHVHIFENRIEISNPGSLPPGVTIGNIKDAQFSRNAIIAARLKDLDYMEEYGRGIDVVLNRMQEWDLPIPIFRNSVNSFQAIILGDKFKGLNERQIRIINHLLLKGKVTARDCQKILKECPRITINTDLKNLRQFGIIEQQGASTSTYYSLKI